MISIPLNIGFKNGCLRKYFPSGIALLILVSMTALAEGGVQPLPAIPGVPTSSLYRVAINGKDVPVNDESRYDFQTAFYTLSGSAMITVRVPSEARECQVLPSRYGLQPQIENGAITFTVSEPLRLVVKVPGQQPLALIATPTEVNPPKPKDADVLYFAPGVHEAGVIQPKSGQTIYLAPGALVKGRIEAKNVQNVVVKGRGILDTSAHSIRKDKTLGILFERSSKITVEGIGVRGGSWWQSLYLLTDDVSISDMNLFGKEVNTDGIDIDGVQRLTARRCFIRCGDDGFGWHAVDARRNGEPPTQDCVAEDCVIWNTTAGNGLRVGASMETRLFERITFRNIDVLNYALVAICSDHSDWAMCKDIRFENFRIDAAGPTAIEIIIAKTRYSNDNGYREERGHYDGLYFTNVTAPNGKIILKGADANHLIDNITFKNCVIGGKPVRAMSDLVVNEFVRNVTFEP
ncbi:MAG: hypothetical protein B9S32_10865 [Verrucomicrobia bacterium Tous-C9LFEB]|nr:MAG: hypothetical protein B9S32_10865 [Verrucomicrobia bacterium Tous-C9LFEB]